MTDEAGAGARADAGPGSLRFRRAPDAVEVEDAGALLVAVPRDGAVDLRDARALAGSARRAWQALPVSWDLGALAASLGGPHPEDDARRFLEQLWNAGLVVAGREAPADGGPAAAVVPPAASAASGDASAAAHEVGPAPLEALARECLRRGLRFRFVARGASMRPQIPDGSLIEVRPAPIAEVRKGHVVAYAAGANRLVAHRVRARTAGGLRARGDSAGRVDEVAADGYLGIVAARLVPRSDGSLRRIDLEDSWRRALGQIRSFEHEVAAGTARFTVIGPLRGSPALRRIARGGLRVLSALARHGEDLAFRVRRGIDVARAGLLTAGEKDAGRRRLYDGRPVQSFTALDENVEAGLTMIEEILLARHPLAAGARVLVLGCGPGRECVALARRGFAVTGLDRAAGMLERARELAARHGVAVRYLEGEAAAFALPGERFDAVVAWSGLWNMVLPREARVRMLEASRACLAPAGRVLLTFLSDYVPRGMPPPAPRTTWLHAVNPGHEDGDRWLLNEAIHIVPHPEEIAAEARAAGFEAVDLWRDQRAYDKARGQVRGYAVLRPREPEA